MNCGRSVLIRSYLDHKLIEISEIREEVLSTGTSSFKELREEKHFL